MPALKLTQVDLNLLVALHALLRERSVTKAGRRVGLSQPAMSASLGKLRQLFGDRLLERSGNEHSPLSVEPAVLARRLGPWVAEVKAQVTCESFMSLPFVLRGTQRIAVMQRRLAVLVAEAAELRLLALPYPSAELRMAMWWNPLDTTYAAHAWLRGVLAEVSSGLEAG